MPKSTLANLSFVDKYQFPNPLAIEMKQLSNQGIEHELEHLTKPDLIKLVMRFVEYTQQSS